jgi:ATP-dependent DNA helicase DinG
MARDLLAAGLQHARGLQPWAELQMGIDRAARDLRLACAGPVREVRGLLKLRWESALRGRLARGACRPWPKLPPRGALAAAAVAEAAPDFPKLEQRARALAALAQRFAVDAEPGHVRWVDLARSRRGWSSRRWTSARC